jgi:Glycosyltransferase Family 4
MKRLSVLLTTIVMSGRTGAEMVTRNIAEGLLRLNHRPVVYTSSLGPLTEELQRMSIPVSDDIGMISCEPDIIHGHNHPTLAAALARFPEVPAIFVCHDFLAWQSGPPNFPQIRRWVAVDEMRADRLVAQHGVPPGAVEILLNAVDTTRFRPTRTPPLRPTRALAYAKKAGHLEAVMAACRARNLELDVIGAAVDMVTTQPEHVLPQYDIVFATGLSAMEAMACGAAVIACDDRGLAGMVTPDTFDTWRHLNFGLRTLSRPVTAEALVDEIDRYDCVGTVEISTRLREQASMSTYMQTLCDLYNRVIAEHRDALRPSVTARRTAVARYIERWNVQEETPRPWIDERRRLFEQILSLKSEFGRIEFGATLRFGTDGGNGWTPLYGFSQREPWGVWTDGREAAMLLGLPSATSMRLELIFRVKAFVSEAHQSLRCAVRVNGHPVENWAFEPSDGGDRPVTRMASLPAGAASSGVLCIIFAMDEVVSPRQLGTSDDARLLGLGLHTLTLQADP